MKKVLSFFYKVVIFVLVISGGASTALAQSGADVNYFSRSLDIGANGEDVKALQVWLNSNGFLVASTGPGSPGNETTLYGKRTAEAVKQFQEVYRAQILASAGLSEGTGRFATKTRAFLNDAIAMNKSGKVLGVSIKNK